jgi:hypothetical protein
MTARLNRSLYLGATATLALDGLAFVLWIVPGHAIERNPLIANIDPASAVLAKLALIVLLGSLTVLLAESRVMTLVLALAACAGLLGFVSTAAAL